MPTRIVVRPQPGAARFPRWGYLDKFDADPQLPRAFAFAILASLVVALGAGRWTGRSPGGEPRVISLGAGRVDLLPPPELVAPPPRPKSVRPPASARRAGVFVPVPNPVVEILPDAAGAAGSGTVTGPSGPAIEVDGWEVPAPSDLRWPSPDDLVVVEHEPALVAMQAPVYPELAREAGIEGTVVLRVLVDEQGMVRDAIVLQSVRGLDEAALAAAATAVFRPARQQDRPVAVWVVLPLEFRLRS
jgi:protein TonB